MKKYNKQLSYIIYFCLLGVITFSIWKIKSVLSHGQTNSIHEETHEFNADATVNDIKLRVLNGCGDSYAADRYRWYITTELKGFDVLETDNAKFDNGASNFNYDNTILLIHNEKTEKEIHELASLLGINNNFVSKFSNKHNYMDATIIIGKDYKEINSYKKTENFYYQ